MRKGEGAYLYLTVSFSVLSLNMKPEYEARFEICTYPSFFSLLKFYSFTIAEMGHKLLLNKRNKTNNLFFNNGTGLCLVRKTAFENAISPAP